MSAVETLVEICLHPDAVALPSGETEWKRIIELAIEHGVAPLLWLKLKDRPLLQQARAQLKAIYLKSVVRTDALRAEQSRIVAAFSGAGVALWTLKGPELCALLYGDATARQVTDLDLLIDPAALEGADALLTSLGYTRQVQGELAKYADAQELLFMGSVAKGDSNTEDTESTEKAKPAFAVDLHQRLLPYQERDPLGEEIRAHGFTAESLLLFLCVNQVTHRFARLKYFLDVEAQLRHNAGALQWDKFLALAGKLDCSPGVFHALDTACRFAGAAVPGEVLGELAPPPKEIARMRKILGETREEFFARGPARDGPAGFRVALLCTKRGQARRKLFWRLLLPPESYLRQELFAAPQEPLLSLRVRRVLRKIRGKAQAAG
jgi:hypothetical protein